VLVATCPVLPQSRQFGPAVGVNAADIIIAAVVFVDVLLDNPVV